MSFSVNASGKPQAVKDEIAKQCAAVRAGGFAFLHEAESLSNAEFALSTQLDFLIRVAPDNVVWVQAVGSSWERSAPGAEGEDATVTGSCSLTIEVKGS